MDNKAFSNLVKTLSLDKSLKQPVYLQICSRLKQCVAQGLIKPGERIPSSRALSQELGVSRGTVDSAYNLLIAEGFLSSHGQAGTRISADLAGQAFLLPDVENKAKLASHSSQPNKEQDYPLPFQMGLPALDSLPRKIWSRLGARTLRSMQGADYAYPNDYGLPELRARIASYLQVSRGVSCRPEQIFITAGYRNSLMLLSHALLSQQPSIYVEDPCFIHTRDVLMALNKTLLPLAVDQHGLQTTLLSDKANAVIVTPAHQSPTSVVLSLPRRLALLEWAAADTDRFIIEDDYDGEFHYASKPLPALKSLDRLDNVIYLGTFSKVLFPAMRLSYMVVPEKCLPAVGKTMQQLQNGNNNFTQKLVADFIHEGHFMRHIQAMRRLYHQRFQLLAESFRQVLDTRWATVSHNAGGMHLILTLRDELDDKLLGQRLLDDQLAVQIMSNWCIERAMPPALMFGFTNVADKTQAEQLAQRVKRAFVTR